MAKYLIRFRDNYETTVEADSHAEARERATEEHDEKLEPSSVNWSEQLPSCK